ncbi:DUF2637 domain-containing protein [Streptomyces sp. S1D4-20]|uniref:DUF2637 domain-containing protein n=1 Tax=Streptomyces sp. S1D4-20 TaxID=2594462 RepID=UPI0011622642|nr:DUF2637 domain-containing protein [Streptomyces sp. S1D4-20]QDN57365.1 DUF2637 domain-containing protein [Streptomyces sp. S1D4-20]
MNGDRPQVTTLQRRLIIAVATGAAVIAAIGFIGSYAAVAKLAAAKGFGAFAHAFPIGIDAGILVLLALDLLLTWLRMPLAMLRHTAWLLTAATIAFNAAAAWPDPIGTGMHAVIPVLFVVVVEAARHAIGRMADITAGRHMDSVRMARWFLDPISTFRLWRRMKLWELRSYDEVIALEQSRLVERARLRARYGRRWRSKAPVSAVMALRLTRYGRALAPVSGVLNIEHDLPHRAIESRTFGAAADQAIDVVQEAEDAPSGHPDTEADTTPDTSGQPDNGPDAASGQNEPPPNTEPVTSPDTHPDSTDALSAIASAASGPADLVKALAAQGVPASALVSEAVRLRPDMVADSIRRTAKRLQAAADGGPYR